MSMSEQTEQVRVLVVEETELFSQFWRSCLKEQYLCSSLFAVAPTMGDVHRMLVETEVGAVVWPHGTVDGIWTYDGPIQKVREKFSGPMIAASAVYQTEQRRAGCDYACDKDKVPELLARLLQLQRKPV